MDEATKQNYIELFEKVDVENAIKAPLMEVIKTYDGTNIEDMKAFLLQMVFLFMRYKELEIKANGFDKLVKEEEELNNKMEVLKKQYNDFMNNQIVPPAINYRSDDNE